VLPAIKSVQAQSFKEQDEIEAIRLALIRGEKSGVSNRTPDDIINSVFEKRRKNGTL